MQINISIKPNRINDVKPALEAMIKMPTKEDPKNPGEYIPMFDNTKDLVQWWLIQQLKHVYSNGVYKLAQQVVVKNDDFVE